MKTVPATAWIALLLYSGLLIAGLLHPLIHPHEECDHAGDHHEQCDLARCLTVPLVLPEIVSVEVGLVYVDLAVQDLSDQQFDRDVITYAPPRGPPHSVTQSIL